MKRCALCYIEKPLDDFARKAKWHQPYCRICQKGYRKRHYLKNRQKYIDKAVRWKDQERVKVNIIKNKPCIDCGICYPPYVMQFDHTSNNKSFTIGSKVGRLGAKTITKEIEKCDIICANCHCIRTHNRRKMRN